MNSLKEILVVGGAGYIGSHMVAALKESGLTPVILDDLSSGRREFTQGCTFIEGNCGDRALLDSIFKKHNIRAVMHFASFIEVGESVKNPEKYFHNNVTNTLTLLDAMVAHQVPSFIFSSTAAVYGEPQQVLINESHPCKPINPYGESKYRVEQALVNYHKNHGLNYGCLRYFNAAGAHPYEAIGEQHDPETHLIPLILQTALGKRDSITIFGNDYNTTDGTCIRDYVHVCDLASAHLKLLEYIENDGTEHIFNLGTGRGFSVKEVIETACHVTEKNITVIEAARRDGDPESLVADGKKAFDLLGWNPTRSDLQTILYDAWQWEQKR